MKPIRLLTYQKGDLLPSLPDSSFSHSTTLFHIYEQTPGYSPILIVAFIGEQVVAQWLSVIRRSTRMFPPSIIKRCEIYGNGDYYNKSLDKENLFGQYIKHLTNKVLDKCFLIEFRNLSAPLFGYRYFRENHYFPVNWLRVYNSLHSLPPIQRITSSRKRQINKAVKNGVYIQTAETEEELSTFLKILKKSYSSKIRKHFPALDLFHLLIKQNKEHEIAKVFLVKHKENIIGGSFCIYTDNNAYFCFSGSIRKTYTRLYPGVMAIWAAITYAYENGYQHFEFTDAGLPFKKNGYRNFILSFGGKQVSTRRWFRFRWNWLNQIACKLHL